MNQPTFTTGPLTTQALIAPQAWGIVKHVEPRLGSTGGTLLVGEAKTFQDAKLFAAAPDLYHALEVLVNELGHKDWCAVPQLGSLNGAVCTCPVKHAEEAMAKARGETK